MYKMIEMFQFAAEGFAEYITDFKMLPLVIGGVLYMLLRGLQHSAEGKRFLRYVNLLLLVLLVPVTGMVLCIYQTRFYDYGWIWSLLPVGAVLAWGTVTILEKEFLEKREETRGAAEAGAVVEETDDAAGEKMDETLGERMDDAAGEKTDETGAGNERSRLRQIVMPAAGGLTAVALFWLCGNQGQLQQFSEESLAKQAVAEAVLEYLEEEELANTGCVWAPREIMQYLRSHNGEIQLFYGKDMWDGKSGAYDYEAYTPEETACYEWMELLSQERNLYLLETDQATEQLQQALAEESMLTYAVENGVNLILLPEQVSSFVERKMENAAKKNGCNVDKLTAGDYGLWIFAQD